ncbi:hypothetical protein F2Q69_00020545 [Brassica cretica]|uniref:RNase H type-1 domain-containing protein n=1 Tax=Brassica cretica TaxID=69181 RepID=A0A8S9PZE2_BRACR|nr:hypothetical protein F2Q69_00020545 [Brassica cretica]
MDFRAWVTDHVKKASLPPLGIASTPLVPWLIWNLWTARNKLVFEGKSYKIEYIITKAIVDAREWEETNAKKSKQKGKITTISNRALNSPSCWIDGAWTHVRSALLAEALALREALRNAKELKLTSLHVFSDSQVLISALCERRDVNEIAGILTDVRNLATLFCPVSFSFIPRLENSQADSLARSGLARLLLYSGF